jgi:glycosyltransferase involved in cell wall biosynthesis
VKARAAGGPPVVATFHGVPTRRYLVARRYRLEMILEIVRRAEECTVLSRAAAEPFARYLLREPAILPGGVNAKAFAAADEREPDPVVFSASSLGDPRKRPDLLFGAVRRLREAGAGVRLRVARSRDPIMSPDAPELPGDAELVDVEDTASLARLYASSWVTVNAAPGEAFGLVLIESLAAGTPVVADSSGAGPEILGDRPVGSLFDPGDEEGLARAIEDSIVLASRPDSREACRERAAEYDWAILADRYEAVYERVLAGASARPRSSP